MKIKAAHTSINKQLSINEQLFGAAGSGSTKDVERCLSMGDCDPLARDDDGYTALMRAAMAGREECVRLLLPVSDPLAVSSSGRSALMWAAREGHEDCVKVLLPVSDPLVRDYNGWPALMLTAYCGHEDCVRLLLPVSNPLAKDNHGRSASYIAMERGYPEVAGMIEAYVLAQKEAALLSTDTLPTPPRRTRARRI